MNKIIQIIFTCYILFCFIACNSDGPAYSIDPPFKSITPVYDTFSLDASEAKVLRLSSGSSLEIPENAFVDKNGNPVKGKVALKYREFHTAADILASGIPMVSNDENGDPKAFESGGMFEISATANGEEINIAKDKKINVNLASTVDGDFDFYYLEEEGSKKTETASLFLQTQTAVVENKQFRWKKIYDVSEDTLKSRPERKANPNAKYFQAHFDTKKYSEAAAIDTIKWEYAGLNKKDDPTDPSNAFFQKTTWSSVRVSQPVYYIEPIKQIQLYKFDDIYTGVFNILSDSLGFITGDGKNYISYYGWDGKLKARFNGATKVFNSWKNNYIFSKENVFINKSQTHILLEDNKYNCKLYSINGSFIKDFGYSGNWTFNDAGDKIIGHEPFVTKMSNSVSVFSLTGNLISSFPLATIDPMAGIHTFWQISSDGSKIAIVGENKLSVFDIGGKLLSSMNVLDIQHWSFSKYNQSIVIHTKNNQLFVWDWKKNKSMKVKYEVNAYSYIINPKQPIIIFRKDKSEFFWNWEKDTYKECNVPNNTHAYLSFSKNGNFAYPRIWSDSGGSTSRALFNKDGNIVSKLNASNWYYFQFTEDEDRVLVIDDTSHLFLIDETGNKIIDFKKYDSQITYATFYSNGNVLTNTFDGTVMLWNKDGKLLNTVVTNKKLTSFYPGKDGFFYGLSNLSPTECWDFKTGKLVYAYNQEFIIDCMSDYFTSSNIKMKDGLVLSRGWAGRSPVVLWKNTSVKLPEEVYRVSFKKDTLEFHTYTYINQTQLNLIAKYQNQYDFILKKEIEEKKKRESKRFEEEDKLLRSFAINNFGIYNWDRFYKDTNAVFVAATMDLDTSVTDFNNITFFLITGKDRNVVIKYYKGTLEKFRFVPEDNNMLIAVLPNDRIAIFEEEKFRQLDIAEIKKKGAHTFRFKILEGEASKALLDQILKKPS